MYFCCYRGLSGGIEVDGAMRIWKRSVMKYKLWYTSMIADGNSFIYPTISEAHPYGKKNPTEKLECVGHMLKHMFHCLASRGNGIMFHKER